MKGRTRHRLFPSCLPIRLHSMLMVNYFSGIMRAWSRPNLIILLAMNLSLQNCHVQVEFGLTFYFKAQFTLCVTA